MTLSRSVALLAAAAVAATAARGDDLASRALLERQQQSDAFSLQLRQSIQSFRAGNLAPQQRLELEALQRDQRLRQSDLHYRQQVQHLQPAPPGNEALRRAEALRFEQAGQQQLSRFRGQAAPPAGVAARLAPLVEPTVVVAPIPRRARPGMQGGWMESAP